MGLLSDTIYENLRVVIQSQIFLIICYAIFAVALFVYLYTGMLLCQQRAYTGKNAYVAQVQANGLTNNSNNFYGGTENWLIATQAQHSPLNIISTSGQCSLDPLIWENHDIQPNGMLLKNTGQTVVLQANYSSTKPTVRGASLPNAYRFVQLSFRWGSNCSFGADHMLNNQKFPLEMHALYRSGTERKVLCSHDMLIVAFVFQNDGSSVQLEPITSNLKSIRTPSKVKISAIPLSVIMPTFRGGFYCYIGSMVEPPYYEGVKWLVYSEPLSVSKCQLKEFRQLLGPDMNPIIQERRPAQKTKQ